MYKCYDCFDKSDTGLGISYYCVLNCYKDHNTKFFNFSENFFCDCGLDECKIKCKSG